MTISSFGFAMMESASDLLPHVFEPFRQGRSGAPHSPSGLGLGLNLAKRLVELHEGQLTVTSEGLNRGTEFIVRLPLVLEAVGAPAG